MRHLLSSSYAELGWAFRLNISHSNLVYVNAEMMQILPFYSMLFYRSVWFDNETQQVDHMKLLGGMLYNVNPGHMYTALETLDAA